MTGVPAWVRLASLFTGRPLSRPEAAGACTAAVLLIR
jgi:hypothetical protein